MFLLCLLFMNLPGFAQKLITGVVTDKSGLPIPGVNVVIKGTNEGVVTGINGEYSISIQDNNTILVFSFIGYITKEYSANNLKMNVVLSEDNLLLEGVVVVGYGAVRKSDLTGSIASISSKNIQQIATSRVDQALQGQIPGLQVTTTSGMPGGNTNILVRGIGSVSGGVGPLVVVDGFPGISIDQINPADIESLEVLKDASATAIYGSRGSNGVIIITTKQGKVGKAKVSFDTYVGFQQPAKYLDMMNAQEYAEILIESRNAGWLENGGPNASITDPNSKRSSNYRIPEEWSDLNNLPSYDTDWQDLIFRTAPIQNYQLSAIGGNESLRYSISGGYFNQEGILIKTGFKRYSARINLDAQLTRRLKVGMSMTPSYSNSKQVPSSGHYLDYNIISAALSMPPLIPARNEDGSYANANHLMTQGMVAIPNPIEIADKLQTSHAVANLWGTAFAEYEIIKGLSLKVSGGITYQNMKYNWFKPSTLSNSNAQSPAAGSDRMNQNINWLNENTLSYHKTIKKHSFDGLLGFTIQKASNRGLEAKAENYPDDLISNVNGGQINDGNYSINEWSLVSYLARLNYIYDNRYLLTATVRTDGSSRFGAENRYGTFPSLSLGWRLSEENFVKKINFFDNLKLRVSYGLSGNNDIGDYRYIGLLSNTYYIAGGKQVPGLYQSNITNSILGWETSKQFDLGLDIGILNNRLRLTADYYRRRNTDMLLQKAISSVSGFTSAWVNAGEIDNKGFELVFSGEPIKTPSFQWSSSFNISFNKNKVIDLGETDEIFSDGGRGNNNITRVGEPIGSFYGRRVEGIFMSEEEIASHATQPNAKPGDYKFRDINNDHIINDEDRDIIGSPHPDFYYGFNNNFVYKDWSLDVLINGVQGNEVFWAGAVFVEGYHGVQNETKQVYNNRYISAEQPGDGKSPRVIRGGKSNNMVFSDAFLYDASFLRIRNVTLSYNIPSLILKKINLQSARVYVNATNLFTFTSYPGYDPEVSHSNDMKSTGIDYLGYPISRSFSFGINLKF